MASVAMATDGARRFRPSIPQRPNREHPMPSPSTSMAESPARGSVGGGGVIFRVKRRREDEPLDALLVAERASKRGSGVSLQACMDSLSIGLGAPPSVETGEEAGGAGAGAEGSGGMGENGSSDDIANSSHNSAQQQDSTRKVFKLLGSVPHDMDTDHQYHAAGGSRSHLGDTSVGDVSQSASPGGASAGGVPGSAEKVRELIRKMTSEHAPRPAVSASAQRQKELARIVDLEVEQGAGGGVCYRSAPSPGHLKGESITSPQGHGIRGSGSSAAATPCSTPAGKDSGGITHVGDGTDVSPDDVGGGSVLLCNGSPLIREVVGPQSPGAGAGVERESQGIGGGGAGQEGQDEYVYDYYWIDPDEGGMGRDIAGGKVANVEVDLDDLWDDDNLVLEEDNWDSDQIEESDDSNAENYRNNDYPDDDEDGDLDDEDFDHSLVGGLYDKPIGYGMLSDEDDSDPEEERYKPQNLTRFAFNASDDSSSEGNGMSD